jgi:restriction system protein
MTRGENTMTIPDYQSLMLPVLEIASKGETSIPLAERRIAAKFNLSGYHCEQMLLSGKQRVLHNLAVDKKAKRFLKGSVR